MSAVYESVVIQSAQNTSGVGTTSVVLDENGLSLTNPAKITQDTYLIHDRVVRNIDLIATAVDRPIFTPVTGLWKLLGVSYTNRVVGSDAGGVTADVMACDSAEAPASGVSQLATADTINLKTTADTPTAVAVLALASQQTVGPGKYYGLNVTGTLTAVVSTITCEFGRVG